MHLKYRRKPKCINKNHYDFPVPFFSFRRPLPANCERSGIVLGTFGHSFGYIKGFGHGFGFRLGFWFRKQEEQVRRRRKIQIECTYVVPGSTLWIKYIRDNIKNGLLPQQREIQTFALIPEHDSDSIVVSHSHQASIFDNTSVTPASTSQSTPSGSSVPSLTRRKRPTIKKIIRRWDDVANADKVHKDTNNDHPLPDNETPVTPVRNSTHNIQLPLLVIPMTP
ncbi:hypothetical protein C1646_744644 [Rhizophagus diaphanus]|nr:hypothetical protein C1646_744644 [Rhizophagus diaphanus] [Rhizophagus sp. MUCL 43196]